MKAKMNEDYRDRLGNRFVTQQEFFEERDNVLVEGLTAIVKREIKDKLKPYATVLFDTGYETGHLLISRSEDILVDDLFLAIQGSQNEFDTWAELAIFDGESAEFAVTSYLDDNGIILNIQTAAESGDYELSH